MRWLALALLLVPMAALAGDNDDSNGENRADDIRALYGDSSLLCADTMNANDAPIGSPWNPSNSTSFTCGSLQTPWTEPTAATVVLANSAGVPFPSGVNPYVFQMDLAGFGDSADAWTFENAGEASNQTVCIRHYIRFHPDATGPSDCTGDTDRIKIGAITKLDGSPAFNAGQQFDSCNNSATAGFDASAYTGETTSTSPDTSAVGGDDFASCQDYWCRVETCVDVWGGAGADSARARHRWTTVGGPVDDIDVSLTGTCANAECSDGDALLDGSGMSIYVQDGAATGMSNVHFRSHNMMVKVPCTSTTCGGSDSDFWIGAASELEGGTGYRAPWRTSSLLDQIMLRGWRAVLLPAGVGG